MNRDSVTNHVAGYSDLLKRAAARWRVGEGGVGSLLDREGRDARDLVRLLSLVDTLRTQTAVP
jgi:hypothetical protein